MSDVSPQSRRASWKSKLAPFMPRRHPSNNGSGTVQLELQNSVDDDLLVVLKQVVRTILQDKDQEVTKGALYRVLRKFARCQVDLKTLQLQLQRSNQELTKSQSQLAQAHASRQVQSVGDQGLSKQQIGKLQQMMVDLEHIHAKQRDKYQQALAHAKHTQASARQALESTTQQRDGLQVELDQQRATTAVCEQVMQALRETLVEKDDCIRQQQEEMERLQVQLEASAQVVVERDETISNLQQQVDRLQSDIKTVEARAIGVTETVVAASAARALMAEPSSIGVQEPQERSLEVAEYPKVSSEVRLQDGKDGGFMLSRLDELVRRRSKHIVNSPKADRTLLQLDATDEKPWRIDELRKRRKEQEDDMKEQLLRIGKTSQVMTGGQATAQSPDRESLRVVPSSSPDRDAATLKTHIAVQEALIKERDDTIEELQAQVNDLSTKLDATVALTASLAMRDLARTSASDEANAAGVDNDHLEELQRTLKHSEGKVAKLKQELSLSKRKLTNSEQKIQLLETFIMEDLQDTVVLGEVTESQRRKKTLDSFEESTRSILDESQMVAREKDALKWEVYELKSQLKIAHAMVTDLEKDRKLLKARVTQIDPLGEITKKEDIEMKMYELSMELADVKVERDALKEELRVGNPHLQGNGAKAMTRAPRETETQVMTDVSEGSMNLMSDRGTRLSFFSAQEHPVSPALSPNSLARESVVREGLGSLFAPSLEDSSQNDNKSLEQQIDDLETDNHASISSAEALQLCESMPAHYAK